MEGATPAEPVKIDLAALVAKAVLKEFVVLIENGPKLKWKAISLNSLYARLAVLSPALGVTKFWILNAEMTELLDSADLMTDAEAISRAMGSALKIIGTR